MWTSSAIGGSTSARVFAILSWLVRCVEAVTFGSALAVTIFFLGRFLTIAIGYAHGGDTSGLELEWVSVLISPLTWTLTVISAGIGGFIGLLAVILSKHRRILVVVIAVVLVELMLPVTFSAIFAIEEPLSLLEVVVQGTMLGVIALAAHIPLIFPMTLGGALLIEVWVNQSKGALTVPRLTLRGAVWAGSALVVAAALMQVYLPDRPDSKLERLVLQLEGRRCDERRSSASASLLSVGWSPYVITCQLEAGYLIGEMGDDATDAVPMLNRLIIDRQDLDTGDGVVAMQSSIAWALGEIGDVRSIEPLARALQMKDRPGSQVGRRAIEEALEKLWSFEGESSVQFRLSHQ